MRLPKQGTPITDLCCSKCGKKLKDRKPKDCKEEDCPNKPKG